MAQAPAADMREASPGGGGDHRNNMSSSQAHAAAQLPLIDLGSSPEGTLGAARSGTHLGLVPRSGQPYCAAYFVCCRIRRMNRMHTRPQLMPITEHAL